MLRAHMRQQLRSQAHLHSFDDLEDFSVTEPSVSACWCLIGREPDRARPHPFGGILQCTIGLF
eukprot:4712251-Pyramimonas_sp.AAC.1